MCPAANPILWSTPRTSAGGSALPSWFCAPLLCGCEILHALRSVACSCSHKRTMVAAVTRFGVAVLSADNVG